MDSQYPDRAQFRPVAATASRDPHLEVLGPCREDGPASADAVAHPDHLAVALLLLERPQNRHAVELLSVERLEAAFVVGGAGVHRFVAQPVELRMSVCFEKRLRVLSMHSKIMHRDRSLRPLNVHDHFNWRTSDAAKVRCFVGE